MKNILITNDDGIFAYGLKALVDEISKMGKVIVVVPDRERSAVSNTLTLMNPVRITQGGYPTYCRFEKNTYICDGTPADCVRFGVIMLHDKKPDLVISGINYGGNLGQDVIYSGTVGAARESIILGIPSIAVSLVTKTGKHFGTAAKICRKTAEYILKNRKMKQENNELFFNINVPDIPMSKIRGIKFTQLGKRKYSDSIEKRYDPYGLPYYWLKGKVLPFHANANTTDVVSVQQNFVSITPLKLDITDTGMLTRLNNNSIPL